MIKSSIFLSLATANLISAQTEDNPIAVTLTNNAAPGTMRLSCDGGQINWSHDGTLLYSGFGNAFIGNAGQLFKAEGNGRILTNITPLNGEYVGNYYCYDAGQPTKGRYYNVVIPGASTLSAGAIAGIIIAVLIALLLIAGVIFFGFRKGWFGENETYENDEGNDILEDGNLNETNSTARFKKPNHNRNDYNGSYT